MVKLKLNNRALVADTNGEIKLVEMNKLVESTYSKVELDRIINYVIKKLQVEDLFKLRDRFEGQLFLNNSIKKIFTLWTLLELLKTPNYKKIKLGFLNTIDFEEFTELKLTYIDNLELIEKIKGNENYTLFSVVNLHFRKCTLYSNLDSIVNVEKKTMKTLEKNKENIYD